MKTKPASAAHQEKRWQQIQQRIEAAAIGHSGAGFFFALELSADTSAEHLRRGIMNAEIHAVDKEKLASEGNHLAVRGAKLEMVIKKNPGLPFGAHKEQHYIEVQATSWDDATQSTLSAQLNADDLQQLLDFACAEGMVTVPTDR